MENTQSTQNNFFGKIAQAVYYILLFLQIIPIIQLLRLRFEQDSWIIIILLVITLLPSFYIWWFGKKIPKHNSTAYLIFYFFPAIPLFFSFATSVGFVFWAAMFSVPAFTVYMAGTVLSVVSTLVAFSQIRKLLPKAISPAIYTKIQRKEALTEDEIWEQSTYLRPLANLIERRMPMIRLFLREILIDDLKRLDRLEKEFEKMTWGMMRITEYIKQMQDNYQNKFQEWQNKFGNYDTQLQTLSNELKNTQELTDTQINDFSQKISQLPSLQEYNQQKNELKALITNNQHEISNLKEEIKKVPQEKENDPAIKELQDKIKISEEQNKKMETSLQGSDDEKKAMREELKKELLDGFFEKLKSFQAADAFLSHAEKEFSSFWAKLTKQQQKHLGTVIFLKSIKPKNIPSILMTYFFVLEPVLKKYLTNRGHEFVDVKEMNLKTYLNNLKKYVEVTENGWELLKCRNTIAHKGILPNNKTFGDYEADIIKMIEDFCE